MKKLYIIAAFISIFSFSLSAQRNDNASQIAVPASAYTGSLQNGSWSPDHTRMMCTNWAGGYNELPANIFIINLSDFSLNAITTDGESNVNMPGLSWSSVLNSIVFSSEHETDGDQIFILNPDANPANKIQITFFDDRMCWEPGFSADGEWIVYEAHYYDNPDNGVIEIYKIDGSEEPVQLTDQNTNAKQPSWSYTGEKIVYQVFEEGVWDIWTMNIDGNNKQNITSTDAGDKTDATFSPNGKWIVYSSDNGTLDYANIFVKNLISGQVVRVSDYPSGYDGAPSWGGNNKIVFESTIGDPDDSPGATLWQIEAPVDGTVGIQNPNSQKTSTIFPNPALNTIQIKLAETLQNTMLRISIFSATGNMVMSEYYNSPSDIMIDISNLANGQYYIQISNNLVLENHVFIK